MRVDERWAMETYDRLIQEAGDDATSIDDARKQFADLYQKAVSADQLERQDDFGEGLLVFDSLIRGRGRKQRRSSFLRDMQYILDGLRSGDDDHATLLGRDDPVFLQAHALGDGRDKTLGLWTPEDWRGAIVPRYRNAAAVTAAAKEFDEYAEEIASILESRGLARTWDGCLPPEIRDAG